MSTWYRPLRVDRTGYHYGEPHAPCAERAAFIRCAFGRAAELFAQLTLTSTDFDFGFAFPALGRLTDSESDFT